MCPDSISVYLVLVARTIEAIQDGGFELRLIGFKAHLTQNSEEALHPEAV